MNPNFHYKGLSKSSGIYIIFNKQNWRKYIGSCKEFKERWTKGHLKSLLRDKHYNRFLQADFNKCGEEAFEFFVLENMPGSTREERLIAEDKWLKIHFDGGKQCYNLVPTATAPVFTEQARRKMGVSARNRSAPVNLVNYVKAGHAKWDKKTEEEKKKWIQRITEAKLGKLCSDVCKSKIRETLLLRGTKPPSTLGMKWGPRSEEAKQKIRQAHLGKKWTAETRMKLVGRKCTEEAKRRMSESKKGRIPWNKGKRANEEIEPGTVEEVA